MAENVKKAKKVTPLSSHKDNQCDCFDDHISIQDKKCIYRSFVDGWSFVPDAGNAQSRGEIFTPRFIVDKMIIQSGMLPKKAIYDKDYSDAKKEYIESRINEPAVGTANYLSTILYHKLQYAKNLSFNDQSLLDLGKYQTHILMCVGSIYAYDIDAGNLEVTRRRLLSSGKNKINDAQTRDRWASYLAAWFNKDPNKKQKITYERLKPSVQASLDQAQHHWYKFVKSGEGIIDHAYKETTGEKMPTWLYNQCAEILDKNIKLFNGIKETDTLDWDNEFFVPGYKNVIWTWWHFEYPHTQGWQPSVNEKEMPLLDMIGKTESDSMQVQQLKLDL